MVFKLCKKYCSNAGIVNGFGFCCVIRRGHQKTGFTIVPPPSINFLDFIFILPTLPNRSDDVILVNLELIFE